jgi:hypothetical protein
MPPRQRPAGGVRRSDALVCDVDESGADISSAVEFAESVTRTEWRPDIERSPASARPV